MPTDKIKKAITWIRRSLEIKEKTSMPGTVDDTIRTTIEAFGWERLNESEGLVTSGAGPRDNTITPVVPAEVLRLVIAASVEMDDPLGPFTLFLEHEWNSLTRTGVCPPFTTVVNGSGVRVGLTRPIVMRPNDRFRGSCIPAIAIGANLIVRQIVIDIPIIGEYVPPV
jgi:hypothetical protein